MPSNLGDIAIDKNGGNYIPIDNPIIIGDGDIQDGMINDTISEGVINNRTSNEFINELMTEIDNHYTNVLWNAKEPLWDDMIDIALALAAIFSIIMIAKVAYKAMVLEEDRIDIMKIWKPIAVSIVLANWYIITNILYAISIPFENMFRYMYEKQDAQVIELQRERKDRIKTLYLKSLDEETKAILGKKVEGEVFNSDDEEGYEGDETEETAEDVYLSEFGEMVTEENEPHPNVDIEHIMTAVKWQHKIESFILWLGETIWAAMILAVFLVRALYITVLVMFGPIHFAASILDAWEDSWKKWIGRYISVCFYAPIAYLALSIVMVMLIMGLKTDSTNIDFIVSNNANWWSWVAFLLYRFIADAAIYIIAIFVGVGVIPLIFELATYVFPSEGSHGAADFYRGMSHYYQKTAVVAGSVAVAAAAKTKEKAKEKYDEHKIEKDKAAILEEMKESEKYDENDADEANTSERNDNQERAAKSWADRLWQEKYGHEHKPGTTYAERENKRIKQLEKDLEGFENAQQDGNVDDFLKWYDKRNRDNKLLANVVEGGYEAIRKMPSKERREFLKEHHLEKTYKKLKDLEKRMQLGETPAVRQKALFAFKDMDELLVDKSKYILNNRGISTTDFDDVNNNWQEMPHAETLRKINEALDEYERNSNNNNLN